jgi:hypothetical protein
LSYSDAAESKSGGFKFYSSAQLQQRAVPSPFSSERRPSVAEHARSLAASKAGNADDPSLIEPVAVHAGTEPAMLLRLN